VLKLKDIKAIPWFPASYCNGIDHPV